MEVQLINYSTNLHPAYLAAAVCVGKEDNAVEQNLISAITSKHLSILEHLNLTFYIQGVSRALSHQLVRHRIASYSQQSQRYVEIDTSKNWYIIPPEIEYNNYAKEKYTEILEIIDRTIKDSDPIVAHNIAKEISVFYLKYNYGVANPNVVNRIESLLKYIMQTVKDSEELISAIIDVQDYLQSQAK